MKTKTQKTITTNLSLILFFIVFLASCKKDVSTNTPALTQANVSAVSAATAVAVGTDSTSHDSIYVIGTCSHGQHLDSVSLSSLPASIADYLTANYAGYTFQKAFTSKDLSANTAGYVVIIQYNGNPVGLKFDASGNFIQVLEQREGNDLSGRGWHEGGRFNDRDGRHKDTIALSSLPVSVSSYFTANYPQDTLVKALRNRDSGYVVFSTDSGIFATVFDANGSFISRTQLQNHSDDVVAVDQSALPAAVTAYLTATYPNYVFSQAFSYSENGVLLGYIVGIDANGTRYAAAFDASGNFLKATTIR